MSDDVQSNADTSGDRPVVLPEGFTPTDQLKQQLGWDTTRVWSNQVQVFLNPEQALFVFREALEAEGMDEQGAVHNVKVARNVASVLMPLAIAKDFAELMKRLYPDDDATVS